MTQPEKAAEPAEPAAPKARKEGSAHKQRAKVAKVETPPPHEAEYPVGRSESKPAPEPALPWTAAVTEQPAPQAAPAPAHSVPKAPSGPTALVTLAVSPWGEVVVDGKSVGVSPPMTELELAPGTYRIEIRNGNFKPYQETLALESNQTIRIKYKFK